MIDMARLEQATLARTFFAPDALLVAESATAESKEAVGWCLHYADPHCPSSSVVVALCVGRRGDGSTAAELLDAVEVRSAGGSSQNLLVGTIRDRVFGLAGLEPVGFGIGIPAIDPITNHVLEARGYQKSQLAQRLTAIVPSYRPPINREAMQLRRTSEIRSSTFLHPDSRSAAGLSHLDIETHRLSDRAGEDLAELNLWFSDPEAEVMNPAMVILDLESIETEDQLSPPESYLIGTAVQSLASRGIAMVETVVDPTAEGMLGQWQALQFKGSDQGAVWKKSLSHEA